MSCETIERPSKTKTAKVRVRIRVRVEGGGGVSQTMEEEGRVKKARREGKKET
jgi:hypothetical protein